MPPSVPAGLRLELSRARLLDGAEANLDAWMQMLHDRYDECQQTLVTEHAAFEATFRHVEADGSTWMYHLSLIGENGSGLDTSIPVDQAHDEWARRTKERGWEELEPLFLLAPPPLLAALAAWGRTGTVTEAADEATSVPDPGIPPTDPGLTDRGPTTP
jgi:hypothetical protein